MSDYYAKPTSETPLAVLIGLDHSQMVWALSSIPPPSELLVPKRRPILTVETNTPSHLEAHRVFKLRLDIECTSVRWVYNNGRSMTPRNAFVYLEQRTP